MNISDTEKLGVRTLAIHAGEEPDPVTGASAPNITMSTTFVVDPDVPFSAQDFGDETPYIYTRWANPTVDQLEKKLAALEGGENAIAFASGMAAISGLLFYVLKNGDHLIMSDVAYAGAEELTNTLIAQNGIEVTKVNLSDLDAVRRAFRPNTRLVYAETPANPIIRLTDIAAVSGIAHEHGVKLAVDSTFASPIATRALSFGADFVVESLTKYIGGHGDAIGGAVISDKKSVYELRQGVGIHSGGILSPFNAWLIMRGLATLPIRMRAHEENALQIAAFLEGHPAVLRVLYPGLPSHPQHELAKRQMKNFSGMLTFQVKNGPEIAKRFARELRIIHYAVSLGHHRSLLFYLSTDELLRTSFRMDAKQEADYRTYAGDSVFRFSIGLEDPDDLIHDLQKVLN